MPAVGECTVAGCSYNHDGCHAFAITVGGAAGASGCRHDADLECTAPGVRIGAGGDTAANCLTYQPA